ncbi:PRC-barrel domain-containing protein [Brevibacillus sp. SYSU BS000544]|uniref:PRC-barrel domain-containing protein n=1 Tax=Brevibacillus sp. SYSU BS000544 TaxID=3416443 RepID=UPI003CE49522
MKQSKEVLGMPIISILDGKDIGKVKNFVINPDQRGIEFLIVQNDQWEFGIKAIPFKLVEGMGNYAVTIETEGSVIDLADIPIANELLTKNIQIKGTRTITKKGRLLGQVAEYFFSEETGKIVGCVLEQEGNKKVLPVDAVLTFGKDIMVVSEDADVTLVNETDFLANSTKADMENAPEVTLDEVADRDLLLLEGKTISSDFYDEQGNLVLEESGTITMNILEKAKAMGRNKVVELSLKVNE